MLLASGMYWYLSLFITILKVDADGRWGRERTHKVQLSRWVLWKTNKLVLFPKVAGEGRNTQPVYFSMRMSRKTITLFLYPEGIIEDGNKHNGCDTSIHDFWISHFFEGTNIDTRWDISIKNNQCRYIYLYTSFYREKY
jgi:hypothetical protein